MRLVVSSFVGLSCLVLGVHLLFRVEELRLDVSGKKYRLRRGLFGAKTREGTFHDLDSLHLERAVVRWQDTDKNSTVWRVYLAWKDPEVERFLMCDEFGDKRENWQRASQTLERISDELGLPATDRTESDRVTSPPAEKGPFPESSVQPSSPGFALPDRPPGSRLSVEVGERSIHVVLRPRPAWRGLLARTVLLLGVLVCVLGWHEFFSLASLVGLALIGYLLTVFLTAHHVIADPRQLTVYKRFAGVDWNRRTLGMRDVQQVYLEVDPYYDLLLGKLGRVVVLSSGVKVEFGLHSREEDKVWVVEALKEIARAAVGTSGASRDGNRSQG